MKRTLDLIASYLLLFMGVGHTVLTPQFYQHFELDALWFAGTGLALVFLGGLNLARVYSGKRPMVWAVLLANLAWMAFNTLLLILIREPQAFLTVGLILILCCFSILQLRDVTRLS